MDRELQRRAFLIGTVGFLLGVPVAVKIFSREKNQGIEHPFSDDLSRYEESLDTPIRDLEAQAPFELSLNPPVGEQWKYLILSSSFLPAHISKATGGEPDTYLAREGRLFFDKTPSGQILISGSDSVNEVRSPLATDEREENTILLLLEEGNLRSAKPKDAQADVNQDTQFRHLLSLEDAPQKQLQAGMKWTSDAGRIKPFKGYRTDYEVVGIAELDGKKTAHIRFSATISDMQKMPELAAEPIPKGGTLTNSHKGDAYFDLETGLLLRQEVDMETCMTGIGGYKAEDGSDRFIVKAKFYVQLFTS